MQILTFYHCIMYFGMCIINHDYNVPIVPTEASETIRMGSHNWSSGISTHSRYYCSNCSEHQSYLVEQNPAIVPYVVRGGTAVIPEPTTRDVMCHLSQSRLPCKGSSIQLKQLHITTTHCPSPGLPILGWNLSHRP